MLEFLRSLRMRAADHREVFAEFAVLLVFVIAEQVAQAKSEARLRVVRSERRTLHSPSSDLRASARHPPREGEKAALLRRGLPRKRGRARLA